MKRYILNIGLIIVTLLMTLSNISGAEWTGQTSGNHTLSKDVTIYSPVLVSGNLTITLSGNTARVIKAGTDMMNQIFFIQDGGSLTIKGNANANIIIDGGATFSGGHPFTGSGNSYSASTVSGPTIGDAILCHDAVMDLQYVTIRNVRGAGNGGGILIANPVSGVTRVKKIDSCHIYNCTSTNGSAIHITNSSQGANSNAENCRVEISNTTIEYCYSTGDGQGGDGGTIRTNGNCVSNLYMRNVIVRNNYTGGSGCGIYWNAKGTDATKCVFEKCIFDNNVAIGRGGAMMLETTFEFTGETTNITNNKVLAAGGSGGGIVVTSYGGLAMAVTPNYQYNFTFNLSSSLNISGNTAYEGAGISFNLGQYQLNTDWNNNNVSSRGITINLNINGATINNNIATSGNGGGIRFFNNTKDYIGNRRITINVNLNKGSISGNSAKGHGAGVYLYNADINNTATTSDELVVINNVAQGNGGGIYVEGGKSIVLKKTTMSQNKAANGASLYLNGSSGVSMTLGETIMSENTASLIGGAIYLNGGSLSMDKSSLTDNIAANNGGALYINGGTLTINGDNSSLLRNSSTSGSGGAAYISGTFNMNGSTVISSNKAINGNGAGIYIADGNCNIATNKSLLAEDNQANNGGVIYLHKGNINADGNINATNNTAKSGGAIYMGSGNFTVNGTATFNSNKATSGDGGGVYLGGGTFKVASNGTVNLGAAGSGNSASGNGGGLYCAGTFEVTGKAVVSHNTAANGGGVCVSNGSVSLAAGSLISNNTASSLGGGLYVENKTSTKQTASFNGGTFTGNEANSGGAVASVGSIALSLAATMEGNTARNGNGGGIYMADGVDMTFGDGLIRNNNALAPQGSTYVTASGKDALTVAGAGGGIFMASRTSLSFTSTEMGIYNNVATNAGADICANGSSTTINLPNITKMNLKGFDVIGNELYWVEDYFTGESYGTPSKVGLRYEDALKDPSINLEQYIVNIADTETSKTMTEYICLDLGYDLVFVKLIPNGLASGDNAAIIMSYPEKIDGERTGNMIQYRKVLISGGIEKRIVGLPSGDWNFKVTPWDFKYNDPAFDPEHTDGYIKVTRGGTDEIEITFTLKEGGEHIDYVKSHEHKKVNRMTL